MFTTKEEKLLEPAHRRETFVPLHTTDLVEFLTQHPALNEQTQHDFRQVAALILSLLHHLYRQRHEQLTYAYAPLDPDRDTLLKSVPTAEHRDGLCDKVFSRLQDALNRANYRQLSLQDIQQAMQAASQWGVRMRVNFSALQRLEVYSRGSVVGQRPYRNWRKLFRKELVEVPLHQRLVVVFRTLDGHPSAEQFDSRKVYLRMFKNVPQQDVDMMLPATGFRISLFDQSRIVLPSIYAVGITLWKLLRYVVMLTLLGVFKTVALAVLILVAIGFGVKSMFTYTLNTRRRYLLSMAQSLYYQNLDNNAGVMLRLLEDGEQQEACEGILAYFVMAVLMSDKEVLSLKEVDAECESIVLEATGISIDFDIEDAARDLIHLGIIRVEGDGWRALDLKAALKQLDHTWDNWFNA